MCQYFILKSINNFTALRCYEGVKWKDRKLRVDKIHLREVKIKKVVLTMFSFYS